MAITDTKNTPRYAQSEWENYARLFAAVTTSVQLDVYREACLHLEGSIVDCGCGSSKIAPFLADKNTVHAYTGIDYAEEMVLTAQWVVQTLNQNNFTVKHARIEDVDERGFNTAVSIQSYYAWPEPLITLQHIYNMLLPGGIFVLATPNKSICLEDLVKDAQRELVAHPDFEAYKNYNLKLAENPQANFIDMDDLVKQVQQVGFRVMECHQRHMRGGLNFLVLRKGW